MRQVLLVLALLVAFAPRVAVAAEADDRAASIVRLEKQRAQVDAQRRELERQYDAKLAEIAKLKQQKRRSWNAEKKLKQLLAEAAEFSTALEKRDASIRGLDRQLAAERKALVAAVERELRADPPPPEARRAQLVKWRADAQARLGNRRVRVTDERIDPLDDPEDLEEKARRLADAEAELRAEEQRLARRAGYYRKQAKLKKARTRADEDPFGDDQPRRQGRGSGARQQGTGGAAETADPSPMGGIPAAQEDSDFTGQPPPAGVDGGGDPDVGGDPAVVYADVVEPETLDELKRAERSGDPEERARAAERARQDIGRRAEEIRKKRLEMERRARELRQSE